MVIETKDLGFVDIDEKNVISFPYGIYGFENIGKFVLLADNSVKTQFMWLQSADTRKPCFIVIDPKAVYCDYNPQISVQMKESIKLESDDGLRLVVIANVPNDYRKITINLKCPVIINSIENIGRQVILEDDRYSMRYPLFKKLEG